jgi:hypothetical protein
MEIYTRAAEGGIRLLPVDQTILEGEKADNVLCSWLSVILGVTLYGFISLLHFFGTWR